jgi:hypothetical protein
MVRHLITMGAVSTIVTACGSTPTDPTRELSPTASLAAGHMEPGIPGQPNCRGQTTAFAAQLGKNSGAEFRGLPGAAQMGILGEEGPLTVQELKAVIDDYCTGSPTT